ncbi:MAG: TRAP transporter large permease subunit [Pirellulaceae bacterium]
MTQEASSFDRFRRHAITSLGVFLCLFTLFEVNYNVLQPQSSLAVFVGVGLALCYLTFPVHKRVAASNAFRGIDLLLAIAAAGCCAYVVVQTEPAFESVWSDGISLGNRAGVETTTDFVVGAIGLILVLEATRRSIGLIVPLLALFFVAHSYYCYGALRYDWVSLPDWMLPHAGQDAKDIVSTTFLQSLGVFGPAAGVMFRYVFLFVVFGSFLEMSGATQFIIDFATKVFGRVRGGPAMVSVVASGLMGSLSGSAVANAVTTGTFTIPMMRSARFPNYITWEASRRRRHQEARVVPPVIGAGRHDARTGPAASHILDHHESRVDTSDLVLFFDPRRGLSLLATSRCVGAGHTRNQRKEVVRIRRNRFLRRSWGFDRFYSSLASRRFGR